MKCEGSVNSRQAVAVALMSVTYSVACEPCVIACVFVFAQVNYNPEVATANESQTARVLGIFSAITTIFFAFG